MEKKEKKIIKQKEDNRTNNADVFELMAENFSQILISQLNSEKTISDKSPDKSLSKRNRGP